jgi:acetoin utilization protein AcuB
MFENSKVQDCMTHSILTVASKVSIRLANQIMCDYHVRHLPVINGSHLVGILSSGDIRRAMPSSATSLSVWEIHALWDKVTVESVMSRNPVTVKPDTSLLGAVRLMYEHRFNSLPVVNELEQLVGILTEVDIFLLLLRSSKLDINEQTTPQDSDYPVAVLP